MSALLIWAVADVAASDPMAAVKAPATSADSMRLDISVPPIASCCATAGGRRCGELKSAPRFQVRGEATKGYAPGAPDFGGHCQSRTTVELTSGGQALLTVQSGNPTSKSYGIGSPALQRPGRTVRRGPIATHLPVRMNGAALIDRASASRLCRSHFKF